MEIRALGQDDFETSLELTKYAFQLDFNEKDKEILRARFTKEQTWGIFDEVRLSAQLAIVPFETYINGTRVAIGGVTRVSTWPELRRQGLISKLILHSLKTMKENGQSLSFLVPFSFGFYRKYGWETYTEYKQYVLETAQFPPRVETNGYVERRDGDIELLSRVYEVYAARYNGTLVRPLDWWKSPIFQRKKGHAAVYFREDGTPAGYALYEIRKQSEHLKAKQFRVQRELLVHEFVFLDEDARWGLWSYLSNHDSMVERAVVTAPVDDALPFFLPDPRIQQEVLPYFMARIVDVQQFIEQYVFSATGESLKLAIRLTDKYAPWNDGLWELTINGEGRASISSLNENDTVSDRTAIRCDIQTLSALLLGYKRPEELHRIGRIGGVEEVLAQWEAIIPRRTTYMLDFF
ncbi:enhanced intracellular survival protein Eis [Paenibacillus sp.]|uniref:GNAT family N-acetyltransferase n=1 Tax=Paenibacillus sp. TaxID=58172 RepID=UPI003566FDB8